MLDPSNRCCPLCTFPASMLFAVLGQLSDNALISGEPVSDEIVQRLVRDAMVEAIEAGE